MWSGILFLSFFGHALGFPAATDSPVQRRDTLTPKIKPGRDSVFDASDLSWITKLAAIGDSYSAGIGAGDRLGNIAQAFDSQSDYACSRYDHSYPYLLNNDERLGDASKRKFQFKSCSGAVTDDVIKHQIPAIDGDQQVILLSIGGNDAELVNVLNQCVYQWAVLNEKQVAVAKAAVLDKKYSWASGFDWDAIGRGCAKQLDHTHSLIEGEAFSSSLDKVLSAAKAKLAKDGKIYLTGYGKFFGEKLSSECDSVSWSTWIYKTHNIFQPEAKLTRGNRATMNKLVDAMNNKLKAAAKRAGSSVKFVNYDSYIGEFKGRYCEPGVDESTSASNTRTGLMFYELNTFDPLGTTPWKRETKGSMNGTFAAKLDEFAEITLLVDPKAEFAQNDEIKDGVSKANLVAGISNKEVVGVSKAEEETGDFEVPSILPDGYGRVFHPQILLHEIIANLVIYNIINDNEVKHGHPEIPEVASMTACPYTEPMPKLHPTKTHAQTTLPIVTPKGSSCVKTATTSVCSIPREPCGPSLSCAKWTATSTEPPKPTFSLHCYTDTKFNGKDGGPMSLEDAEDAINQFCDKAKEKKIVTHWNPDAGTHDRIIDYGNGKSVDISVDYDLSSGHPSGCYKEGPYDFSTDEVYDACKKNLGRALNWCTTVKDPDNDTPYWKKGGRYQEGCQIWKIRTGPEDPKNYGNILLDKW